MDYAFHHMEPKLRERAEIINDESGETKAGTSRKHYYYYGIESELRMRNDDEQYDEQEVHYTRNSRRYSSKGLSIYAPDAKTFKLLLSFSWSRRHRISYGNSSPHLHAEILHRLHQDYSDLISFIETRLLVPLL